MKLTKEAFEILSNIEEGMNDLNQIYTSTNLEKDKIKEIFLKLEKLNLITITKKYDSYYKEDYWNAKTTKEGLEVFNEYLKSKK
ncbi:hypothetical protein J4216_01330 [Candidatus Woesearchaeota archaeon]|nr:hypothetical protein [Candidatus Woesearchaeota archaeon]